MEREVDKNIDIQEVDIYDFDKTCIPFDSAMKYWGYVMLHCPWTLILLPFQFIWGMMMLLHIISVPTCKKIAFTFVNIINNKKTTKKFWDKYEKQVYEWFKPENRKRTTVLISASPDFLIEEIASRLNVEYAIATKISKHGVMQGPICRKEEKVKRFRELLPDAKVIDVYSDNADHDRYIFELGEHSYLVTNGEMKEIDIKNHDIKKSVY